MSHPPATPFPYTTCVRPMAWEWPVEVNNHEAKAFCNWKKSETGRNVRLPTEDEWYRLYDAAGCGDVGEQPADANIHLDHGDSACLVNRFRQGDWYGVVGNVWQWTETPTYPFEGFDVYPIYDDFTNTTFDGRNHLIKVDHWEFCGHECVRGS